MTRAAYYLTAYRILPSSISRYTLVLHLGGVTCRRHHVTLIECVLFLFGNFIFESDHFKYKISVISQSSILSFRLETQINKIQTTTLGFIQSFLSKKFPKKILRFWLFEFFIILDLNLFGPEHAA